MFEQLRGCRSELAASQNVPPFIICSDKTLKDMCAKCPQSRTEMKAVYGMGVQKVESYGENFIKIIAAFLKEYGNMRTTEETVAEPLRKKKQPFYIAPEKLDEVELTDRCTVSEFTKQINELCEETNRKKLTAKFVNELLLDKGYLKETAEQGEEKHKRVTEKGRLVGILEEERHAKYGKSYYALIHTRESQSMILTELKEYFASQGELAD